MAVLGDGDLSGGSLFSAGRSPPRIGATDLCFAHPLAFFKPLGGYGGGEGAAAAASAAAGLPAESFQKQNNCPKDSNRII